MQSTPYLVIQRPLLSPMTFLDSTFQVVSSIKLHAEMSHAFKKKNDFTYSEMDYLIKFWGYVFETNLGRDRYILHC